LLEIFGPALALADDPEGAVTLLRPAFERLWNDDLGYRLAGLEAIAGGLKPDLLPGIVIAEVLETTAG
jgi:hypothetical protein